MEEDRRSGMETQPTSILAGNRLQVKAGRGGVGVGGFREWRSKDGS